MNIQEGLLTHETANHMPGKDQGHQHYTFWVLELFLCQCVWSVQRHSYLVEPRALQESSVAPAMQ